MPKQVFNRKVLKRFLSEEELTRLETDYNANKHKYVNKNFGEVEIKMFKEAKMGIEDWQKHWNLKSRESVARRLGCLYLFTHGLSYKTYKPKEN